MKKKIWLLLVIFIAFYLLAHSSAYLPDLLHGRFSLVDERSYEWRLLGLLADITVSFLFSLGTYLLLCTFYPVQKYVQLFAGLVLSFVFCFAISYLSGRLTGPDPIRLAIFFRQNILFDGVYVIFAMVFYFMRYAQHKELQQKELVLQNNTAELSFLRSQVNPHFLFNNLNNIYSLVYQRSEQALPAISGLSELLRYMLYDTAEQVELAKEISYLEKYIALQQLRFEHPSNIGFLIEGETSGFQIPPLLLIPFVENAFKHGDVKDTTGQPWLNIHICVTQNVLTFTCHNTIAQKRKDETGGIGIENVRKRLALLYPDQHVLDISTVDQLFTVNLSLTPSIR
ncbi:MAG: histidine kinase [Bacteroidota bacterium]